MLYYKLKNDWIQIEETEWIHELSKEWIHELSKEWKGVII